MVISKISWLIPLHYEINVNESNETITTLLDEPIDKDVEPFDRYEIEKVKITM